MAKKDKQTPKSAPQPKKTETPLLFSKENYILMIAGVLVIFIGFWLMAGKEDIFSTTKITVAPLLVLAGFVIEVFAIFYKKKSADNGDA